MRTIENRLVRLEAMEAPAAPPRPGVRLIVISADDARAAADYAEENPDTLVITRVIVSPPERDADGKVIAPARDYRGPIEGPAA